MSNAQKIDNVETADFGEDGTTISVTVTANDTTETFHVQTHEGLYRPSLGCWILTDDSNGEINQDDFEDFDFSEIIAAAEREAEDYLDDDKEENPNFINKDSSPYTHRFLQ